MRTAVSSLSSLVARTSILALAIDHDRTADGGNGVTVRPAVAKARSGRTTLHAFFGDLLAGRHFPAGQQAGIAQQMPKSRRQRSAKAGLDFLFRLPFQVRFGDVAAAGRIDCHADTAATTAIAVDEMAARTGHGTSPARRVRGPPQDLAVGGIDALELPVCADQKHRFARHVREDRCRG